MRAVDCDALPEAGIEILRSRQFALVEAAAQLFYERHGAHYLTDGERGRQRCREDIQHHLGFLLPALASGAPTPFVAYLRWVSDMLDASRFPRTHVIDSVDCLIVCICDALPEHIASVKPLWERVQHQLAEPLDGPKPSCTHFACQTGFEELLLNGDRLGALHMVQTLQDQGHTLIEIEVKLIGHALQHIGLRWQRNEVSVAQEHLATATASAVMADRYAHNPPPPSKGQRALLACVQGNMHALGLRTVADALEFEGWEVQCLGANTPTADLLTQIRLWRPHMVALSLTIAQNLVTARDAIRAIRQQWPVGCPHIVVGGEVLNQHPDLVHFLDADAYASDALSLLHPSSLFHELPKMV